MKIAFGMIVLNGDYVLKQCLESIYPFANQILIAEGPVLYWQEQGLQTSNDLTNEILHSFPDPENKIKIHHGQYSEKDEQCNAYMQYLNQDNDYIWNVDSDETFKPEDIEALLRRVEAERITTVGFKSCTFFGGFDYKLTGFEERAEFIRIRKIYPGSYWATHRPPTIAHAAGVSAWPENHLNHDQTAAMGIKMYHYSYVFPQQVKQKVAYYKAKISKDLCIDNYFENVWMPWVSGNEEKRKAVEEQYNGVHEFTPASRGDCRTEKFIGTHPEVILKDLDTLKLKFEQQLKDLEIESTCWYSTDCLKNMLSGTKGVCWPILEESGHFPALLKLLLEAKNIGVKTIIDLGCGGGAVQNTEIVKNNFKATGIDLPGVIDNVAMLAFPDGKYEKKDVLKIKNFSFLESYDMVLMNGFIEILPRALEKLDEILKGCKKYVLIHRQFLIKEPTITTKEGSYFGTTFISKFNNEDFEKVLQNNNFSILLKLNSGIATDNYSLLFKKDI